MKQAKKIFLTSFVLLSIIFIGGLASAISENGKITLSKTATKIYSSDSDNLEYGRKAKVNLSVNANPYSETTTEPGKLDIVLVMDGSTSMSWGANGKFDYSTPSRLSSAKKTTYDFINSIMDNSDDIKLGLVEYGNDVKASYPMTTNKITALTFTNNLSSYGGTNLQSGIKEAHKLLDNGGRENVKKVVIILTDGIPTFFNYTNAFGFTQTLGNGDDNEPVCLDFFCTETKRPSQAAKEELDSLKTNYNEADIYTITFGNESEAASILTSVNPTSTDPIYQNLTALNGEQLKAIFDQIITQTQNVIGKNSIVTDTIPATFSLTENSINELNQKGVIITNNPDGSTTLTWNIDTIKANEKNNLSYEVIAKDDYHGSMYTNTKATLKTKVDKSNPYYEQTDLSLEFAKPTVEIPAITNDDHYKNNITYIGYGQALIEGSSILTNDKDKNTLTDKKMDSMTVLVNDEIVINENSNTVKNLNGTYSIYKDGTLQGILTMKKDGSFSFQPEANIIGEVTFTYHIKTSINEFLETEYVYSNNSTVTLNIKERKTIDINGSKIWNDQNNQDGLRPDAIEVNLYQNDTLIKTVTVTKDNWNYSFENLYRYALGHEDDSNYEFTYKVKEKTKVNGYTTSYNGFNIINSHNVIKTSISGTKTWNDANNQDGMRPDSITVNLTGKVNNDVIVSKSMNVTKDNNWNYEFTNLDKYYNGTIINYSISENEVDGYTGVVTGYNIENTHNPIKISINGEKKWVDQNNLDGLRPNEVTINLTGKVNNNVIVSKTTKATKDNNWNYQFTNLDKYYNGSIINYSVSENEVEHYTTSYDQNNPYIIINTHNPKNVTIEGSKTWVDENNLYGRPDSITVILTGMVGDKTIISKEKVVNANDNWHYSFTNLPEYKDGKLINYTISEKPVKDYDTIIDGYDIINTYNPETIDIKGLKVWNDFDNQDGLRPDEITVNLLVNDNVVATTKATKDNNWTFEFNDQVKYANGTLINYSIEEVDVLGYTSEINDFTITNSHTPETVSYQVTKVWNDFDNQDGIRPNEITVHLLANGNIIETQTINEENNWEYVFENLPKYNEGQIINYQIIEDEVDGYTSNISNSITEQDNNNSIVITNTHEVEKIDITINKYWEDFDNLYNSRPDSITVHLFADGILLDSVILTKDNNWSYTFENLDKYSNGKEINYTIVEEKVEKYYTTYDGYNITNTFKPYGNTFVNDSEITPPHTGVITEESNNNIMLYLSLLLGLLVISIKKIY